MAEGWTQQLKGDVIEPHSAGTDPHGMNERAIKVMAEAGVDISKHTSKHVDDVMYIPFDYVVTVCSNADETCPVFPGKTWVVHVGFDDPPKLAQDAATEEEALSHYRSVRDEIKTFVSGLPDNLEPDPAA